MSGIVKVQKILDRWYPLEPIPIQLQLVRDRTRFIIVCAGRRSGKTERAKRKLVKAAMNSPNTWFFAAAPTYAQTKKIFWHDLKQLAKADLHAPDPLETELIIFFSNGAQIHLIGLNEPERMEGVFWGGGLVDETGKVSETAIKLSILPALDTKNPRNPGYRPWCWFLGKPVGMNHYYDMFEYAASGKDPQWAAYHWKSSILLDADAIDAAKRRMSDKHFKQEYEATFESVSGRLYEDYGPENHTDYVITAGDIIDYFCDFNFTPMSHGIGTVKDNKVYITDNIVLSGVEPTKNVIEFTERYINHAPKEIRLYGDSSGRVGEKHNIASYYDKMEEIFKDRGWKVDRRVKYKNPPLVTSQNAVRAMIRNAFGDRRLFVNPKSAEWVDKGLSTLQTLEGSLYLEDDDNKYQHIITGLRYYIDYEFPDIIDFKGNLAVRRWNE